MESWVIGAFEEVIDRDIEVIGDEDKGFVVGLTDTCLIPADAVLRHIKFDSQSLLGHMLLFA